MIFFCPLTQEPEKIYMKLFLVGGFLGSGKTTAIHQACSVFLNKEKNVAVITNDQGTDLVDTHYMKSAGIKTAEVLDGCFCCNYKQFIESIQQFQATVQPEIIFAESVGSCTDLIATIAKPLNHFHPEITIVISVFADAQLIHAFIEGNASFRSDQVRYIYKKQLAEADILVINKVDLLTETEIRKVKDQIRIEYPEKTVLYQNSLHQSSVEEWTSMLMDFELISHRKPLDLDYILYGEGEAMLAWVDQKIIIEDTGGNVHNVANQFIHAVYSGIKAAQHPVAHLKFFLDDGIEQRKISFTSSDFISNKIYWGNGFAKKITILMNARVEATFYSVEAIVSDVMEKISRKTGVKISLLQKAGFQPSYPLPTHRMI